MAPPIPWATIGHERLAEAGRHVPRLWTGGLRLDGGAPHGPDAHTLAPRVPLVVEGLLARAPAPLFAAPGGRPRSPGLRPLLEAAVLLVLADRAGRHRHRPVE